MDPFTGIFLLLFYLFSTRSCFLFLAYNDRQFAERKTILSRLISIFYFIFASGPPLTLRSVYFFYSFWLNLHIDFSMRYLEIWQFECHVEHENCKTMLIIQTFKRIISRDHNNSAASVHLNSKQTFHIVFRVYMSIKLRFLIHFLCLYFSIVYIHSYKHMYTFKANGMVYEIRDDYSITSKLNFVQIARTRQK